MPPRLEVVSGGTILGEPTPALVRAWQARGARSWIAARQLEPGVWTSSQGPSDARSAQVTLRPV